MNHNFQKTQVLAISAILIAFAVLIPVMMPLKLVMGSASYTLASHVPIFIAAFISPRTALAVALGAAAGFFLAGFDLVIVARALSHVVFALIAALVLRKSPSILNQPIKSAGFALLINLIHGLAEVVVVYILTASSATEASYWHFLFLLIGLGTLIHGMVDYYLAFYIWKAIPKKA